MLVSLTFYRIVILQDLQEVQFLQVVSVPADTSSDGPYELIPKSNLGYVPLRV